eukprot:CAMPEP_0113445078 /NCGR_PEP_ID=MMETSP0014_2-20120614/2998_1 /TAXON_ID=2857 /ORGANISM="Nitzschia sp." /LENGTH=891 /DNA_ID=CAMNT_0000336113 /DNA_START=120 /DNA_END=2792 /DNA_ORIENTATION=- /assembly_acc=CAM_ASM_000159
MPSLRLLGKNTIFSSDDIQNGTKCMTIFRIIQICFALPFLILTTTQSEALDEIWGTKINICLAEGSEFEPSKKIQRLFNLDEIAMIFSAFSFAVATTGLILYLSTYQVSFKGTPTDTSSRKAVDVLCHVDLTFLGWVRIVNFAFGALLAALFVDYCKCAIYVNEIEEDDGGGNRFLLGDMRPPTTFELAEFRQLTDSNIAQFRNVCTSSDGLYQAYVPVFAGLVTCQGIDCCYLCFVYFIILVRSNPFTSKQYGEAERRWYSCLYCAVGCLSCLSGDCLKRNVEGVTKQGDFSHMAHMLDRLFDTDTLDVTVSDLTAGLHITKLLHFESEYLVRKQIAEDVNKQQIFVGDARKEALKADDEDDVDTSSKLENESGDDPEPETLTDIFDEIQNSSTSPKGGKDRRAGLMKRQSRMPYIPSDASPAIDRINRRGGVANLDDDLRVALNYISEDGSALSSHDGDELAPNANAVGRFIKPKARTALSAQRPEDREIIAEACRYIPFAASIYQWSLLDKKSKSFSFCRRAVESTMKNDFSPVYVKSDHAGRAMIVAPIAGVAEKDIVYARYECDVFKTPFAVVLDHRWNSIVVTVRGSTALDDFVTDMTVDEVELTEWGKRCGFDGEGRFAHRGFLDSSGWIYDEIEKDGVLEKLSQSRLLKNYRLRIVGHSLGAGISTILALFYRSKFPSVKAVAFEPPGCTVSSKLAAESRQWTLSFVNATDCVPRMNFATVVELRDEVLFNIARIKISKQEVYRNKNIHKLGIEALREFLKDALHPEGDVDKDTEFMKGLVIMREGLNKRLKEQIAKGKTYDLNIPGCTVCFIPSIDEDRDFTSSMANFTCCSSSGVVVNTDESKSASAIYTDGETDYTNIIYSDELVNDHLCPSIEAILEKL